MPKWLCVRETRVGLYEFELVLGATGSESFQAWASFLIRLRKGSSCSSCFRCKRRSWLMGSPHRQTGDGCLFDSGDRRRDQIPEASKAWPCTFRASSTPAAKPCKPCKTAPDDDADAAGAAPP